MGYLENYKKTLEDLSKVYSQDIITILIILLGVAALIIVLRIIVSTGYQTQYIFYWNQSRKDINYEHDEESRIDFKTEDDKKRKISLISKVMHDYKKYLESGVTNIDTTSIINKYMLKYNFLGWSYSSIEKFIASFEQAIIFIGIMLVVFLEEKNIIALSIVCVFIILKLLATFFDFDLVRTKLLVEIKDYVEKNFVAPSNSDLNTIIIALKNDIHNSIEKQADTLKESIDKMGSNLTGALALSISEMTKSIEGSIKNSEKFIDELEKPLKSWTSSIQFAKEAQEELNLSYQNLNLIMEHSKDMSNIFKENNQYLIDSVMVQTDGVKNEIITLNNLTQSFLKLIEDQQSNNSSVTSQVEYLQSNQKVLKSSIESYEATLQDITTKMAEAFSGIVEVQVHKTYQNFDKVLQEKISTMLSSNNNILTKLRDLFSEMAYQTKNQTNAILKVKEQIDMNYENYKI